MVSRLLDNASLMKFKAGIAVNEKINKAAKPILTAAVAAGIVSPTFCETNINDVGKNVITAVFSILQLGGIILAAVGIVQLVRAIMEASQGQSQPGAVGKALGMILGGVVMAAAKAVLKALGINPDDWIFVNE